jgi:3-hexulose-6-phosphate synthase/6-phospho-3-hexuloisomerase
MMATEGVDAIVLHTSYDARHESPIDPLEYVADVVAAVNIPVQVVGGLSIDNMVECVHLGAPLVVVGAPLVVDDERFAAADELEQLNLIIQEVVRRVKGSG